MRQDDELVFSTYDASVPWHLPVEPDKDDIYTFNDTQSDHPLPRRPVEIIMCFDSAEAWADPDTREFLHVCLYCLNMMNKHSMARKW